MAFYSRVLTGIGAIVILFAMVITTGCNRDQSSSSQQASSTSPPAADTAQNSPAALTQSPSTADAANSTTGSSADTTKTTPTTPATAAQASSTTTAQTASAKAGLENYGQVTVGMTSKQVIALMGKASKIEQEGQTTEWEYRLAQGGKFELRLQNDKVISISRR